MAPKRVSQSGAGTTRGAKTVNGTKAQNGRASDPLKPTPERVQKRVPTRPELKDCFTDFVLIHVGTSPEETHVFGAYTAILCNKVEYFRRILARDLSREKLYLPDVKPEVFKLFMQWLMAREIVWPVDEDGDVRFNPLIELYLLGEKFESLALMNFVIQQFASVVKEQEVTFNAGTINLIYRESSVDDPLRRLAVDLWAWNWGSEDYNRSNDRSANKKFWFDVARRQTARIEDDPKTAMKDPTTSVTDYYVTEEWFKKLREENRKRAAVEMQEAEKARVGEEQELERNLQAAWLGVRPMEQQAEATMETPPASEPETQGEIKLDIKPEFEANSPSPTSSITILEVPAEEQPAAEVYAEAQTMLEVEAAIE